MGLDKDDIKQLIAILQKGLADDVETEPSSTSPAKSAPREKQKKQTQKEYVNLFDGMSESRLHKEDVEIDKKLSKFPPTQRARNYKPINVRCRVCGKSEEINPSLVESVERYKCNKCSTSSG